MCVVVMMMRRIFEAILRRDGHVKRTAKNQRQYPLAASLCVHFMRRQAAVGCVTACSLVCQDL